MGGPKAALGLLLALSGARFRFETGVATRCETGSPLSDCGFVLRAQQGFLVCWRLFYFCFQNFFRHGSSNAALATD
jgi:hypothetical protein